MDTRQKIVGLDRLVARLRTEDVLLAGLFDPMTAEEGRRLAAAQPDYGRLFVAVIDVGGGLLTADARAALVAALRAVHGVAICTESEWRTQTARLPRTQLIEDWTNGQRRSEAFATFIVERQNAR